MSFPVPALYSYYFESRLSFLTAGCLKVVTSQICTPLPRCENWMIWRRVVGSLGGLSLHLGSIRGVRLLCRRLCSRRSAWVAGRPSTSSPGESPAVSSGLFHVAEIRLAADRQRGQVRLLGLTCQKVRKSDLSERRSSPAVLVCFTFPSVSVARLFLLLLHSSRVIWDRA